MTDIFIKKNKIVLSDYPYQKDIENRLLMSELTLFEVDVLKEILDSSLKFFVSELAEFLDVTEEDVLPVLDKFSTVKLVQRQDKVVHVDKDMRRYYESQILKFDDLFEPDIEFLQGLLSKVPIHVLPNWYSIPRTSDNIIQSIINNHLATPKIYERYLNEIAFDDPVMKKIVKDLFATPDFKLSSHVIKAKYNLDREQFEEIMLHLEFNFICCLGYNRNGDIWEEIVTPFYEWRTLLRFQRDTMPASIKDVETIQRTHSDDFGFVNDLTLLLKTAKSRHLTVELTKDKQWALSPTDSVFVLPHIKNPESYTTQLIKTILQLQMAEVKQNQLTLFKESDEWLNKDLREKAIHLYRTNLVLLRYKGGAFSTGEKDLREVEKSLKRVMKSGWILFDDYLKGFISPIGNSEQVVLENKGKRWRYVLPAMTEVNKTLIKNFIQEELFHSGIVTTGTYLGKFCFCVTPFGRLSIDG